MKYLLVLVVVGLVLWLMLRARGGDAPARRERPAARDGTPGPAAMVACAHCDLRLPRSEAVFDAAQRPYCGDAHRQAGPR